MDDRDSLLQALDDTHHRMHELVEALGNDRLQVPYHPGVNPPLWEFGHCAFFYEVFVRKALDGVASYDPSMDEIWDSFHLDHEDRWRADLFPGKADTLRYVDAIHQAIRQRILEQPLTDQAHYLTKYAIFHQNMHLESMIWCRQTEGYPVPPGSRPEPTASADPAALGDADIPAGRYTIGMPAHSPEYARRDFAFDNEKPGFEVHVPAFRIARTLVSNGDFRRFVEDGGYQRPELWTQGGRKWLTTEQDLNFGSGAPQRGTPTHPYYWRKTDRGWEERHFDQWRPLHDDYPVKHVTYWEAEAYCRWAGRRLPTEVEWEVAALGNLPGEPQRRYPWGDTMDSNRVDMDGTGLASQPVSALPEGDSPFGCRQMLGTLWEWTSDQFFPYDGFAIDMYPFMSTLQFGDHKVTKGGSCGTSSRLIRGSYRQAYLPNRHDVFVGFRTCALDE
ncbi:selenoneine synthase SenA [Marinimicrobium koreense]|uniref:selenoneine synthase SenA n=1 Tax=Marinimicrobium koreense TaxID=306545 RepID=UPI003F700C5E